MVNFGNLLPEFEDQPKSPQVSSSLLSHLGIGDVAASDLFAGRGGISDINSFIWKGWLPCHVFCQNMQGNTCWVALIQQWCLLILFSFFSPELWAEKADDNQATSELGSSGKSHISWGVLWGVPVALAFAFGVLNLRSWLTAVLRMF